MKIKYAGIKYSDSTNLGDMIQTIAATQHLPTVDNLYERNTLKDMIVNDPTLIIMQSWFPYYRSGCFPPSKNFIPVFFGFHIACGDSNSPNRLLEKDSLAYLKQYEPIGCRDEATRLILQERGIKAFFSGCLTLTLPKRKIKATKDQVFIVDAENIPLPRSIMERERTYLSHIAPPYTKKDEKLKIALANKMLNCYRDEASLVITTRLHCALPCVAMGIPVVLFSDPNDPRLSVAKWAGLPIHPFPPHSMFGFTKGSVFGPYFQSLKRRVYCKKVNWSPEAIDFEAKKEEMIKQIQSMISSASSSFQHA